MKEAAKFDRQNPCTKVHLWNAFRRPTGYPAQTVVQAKMMIGDNAPKYLVREGYLRAFSAGGIDFYQLTQVGVAWLEKGIRRYLELHPEAAADLEQPLPGVSAGVRRVRPKLDPPSPSGTPVVRRKRV